MVIECGTTCFLIKFSIWCCNSNFTSRLASSGIFGFEVVDVPLQNPVLLKKLSAHAVDYRLVDLRCSSLLLAPNALPVVLATTVLTKPHFFLNYSKKCFTLKRGLPCFKRGSLLFIAFSCLVI